MRNFNGIRLDARKLASIAFAIGMLLIPWPEIFRIVSGFDMIDREVYRSMIEFGSLNTDYIDSTTLVSAVFSEYLWGNLFSYVLRDLGIAPDLFFGVISFYCILTFSLTLTRFLPPWGLLLLVNPLVVDFAFSQLRLALAISIILHAYLIAKKHPYISIGLLCLTPFIHTTSLIFLTFGLASLYLSRKSTNQSFGANEMLLGKILLVLLGIVVALVIGPLRSSILSSLGDRRAEYIDIGSSILYLSYWIVLFFILTQARLKNMAYPPHNYALAICAVVFVNSFTGGYSTRFLAASFPILVAAIFSISKKYGNVPAGLFLFYFAAQWLFWLGIL